MAAARVYAPVEIVNPATILEFQTIREEDYIPADFTCPTKLQEIQWCAQRRLLANTRLCEECQILMSLTKAKGTDGHRWLCKICKKVYSIRKDSFFSRSHLSLFQALKVIYEWANETPQSKVIREARLGRSGTHTCVDWFSFCRDVCEQYFIDNPISIGGIDEKYVSRTVEIDESKFFHRKYHRGRWTEGHWVFGGIERESKRCFMVEVPDRSAATLTAIIQRHILPGTIIMSDGWRAYNDLGIIGGGMYEHQVVIHKDNFVDPNDRTIHTQRVENMWMRMKRKLRRQFGTSEALFESYLHEFVWRNQYPRTKIFQEFLICVAQQYVV